MYNVPPGCRVPHTVTHHACSLARQPRGTVYNEAKQFMKLNSNFQTFKKFVQAIFSKSLNLYKIKILQIREITTLSYHNVSYSRKMEGPQVYARYMGSSGRAKWPTFLPSQLQNLLTYETVICLKLNVIICGLF